jgi:hypothetical protein
MREKANGCCLADQASAVRLIMIALAVSLTLT